MRIPLAAYPAAFVGALVAGRVVAGGGSGPADDGAATAADPAAPATTDDDGWGGFDSSGTQFPAGDGGGVLQTPIDAGSGGTTPTPKPTKAYLVAKVNAGTINTYTTAKLKSGTTCSKRLGDFRTGGFTAEVRDLGVFKQCDGDGTRQVYRVLTGVHEGKNIRRQDIATLTTKYR